MTDVLAVAESRRGSLRDVSFELITAGRELADELGGDLHLAVVNGDVEAFAESLNRTGVDVIHTVAAGEEFNHDVYTQAVTQLYESLSPTALLMPNTVNGLDYAPAVANALDLPLVTDVVGFEDGDEMTVTREQYGGKVETNYDIDAETYALTIRPAEWPQAEGEGDASVEVFEADIDESAVRSTVNGFEEVGGGDVDISEADVLVSVGRGIEEEENIVLVEALADALGATLSSSRPIVDNGWLPKNRQVGQSGKVVTPDVYIAIGISGAVQHVAGMKGAETIIAINTDPNAPIFDLADYGIVDDLFEVVPELIEEFGGEAPNV
jgi:electron transfer flavoprotein alpha subunit